MKSSLITITMICSFLFSCNTGEKEEIGQSSFEKQFHNDSLIFSLRDRIVKNNDTTAYLALRDIYISTDHHPELMAYAYFIANKTDLAIAYFDIFANLSGDKEYLRILGNYYLLLAAEKGCEDAKYALREKFKDSLDVPTAKEYLKQNRFCEAITSEQ